MFVFDTSRNLVSTVYTLFSHNFTLFFVQLFLIRTAHALPYDNAPSGVCTFMEEEETNDDNGG
jgi:hypothetical protein